MAKVVCNASPIIGLLKIGRLNLLWELFEEVLIPQAVYDEVTCGRNLYTQHVEEIDKAVVSGKIKVFQVKNREFIKQLYGKLHEGELETVIGAKELGISTAVIDERAARNFASSMLVDTIGIIGILHLAKRLKKIDQIKFYLDELLRNQYRISRELYKNALKKAGEND